MFHVYMRDVTSVLILCSCSRSPAAGAAGEAAAVCACTHASSLSLSGGGGLRRPTAVMTLRLSASQIQGELEERERLQKRLQMNRVAREERIDVLCESCDRLSYFLSIFLFLSLSLVPVIYEAERHE